MTDTARRFLDAIRNDVILGDGAMGTELLRTAGGGVRSIEALNLDAPLLVRRIHEAYLAAGSRLIETNSFGANRLNLARLHLEGKAPDINRASVALAREAAGSAPVIIAGSVGPVHEAGGSSEEGALPEDALPALVEQALTLVEAGVDVLMLETFIDCDVLSRLVRAVRAAVDTPIIAQMAFEEGGRTPRGDDALSVARALADAGADVVGANCGGGVPAVMKAASGMRDAGRPLSAFLNAGFAERLEGRRLFKAEDSYLAQRAVQLARLGVRLIGGCCGTTPATIAAMAVSLGQGGARLSLVSVPASGPAGPPAEAQPVDVPAGVLVELDPPRDLQLDGIRSCAAVLAEAGVRYITLADNPMASARVDNIAVAGILRRELGIVPVAHLTGRDRNRIALQSSIMAAHCTGIRHLLCVTGDPVRMHNEANTSGVFDVNAVSLVRMVSEFNLGMRLDPRNRTAFTIGVALNPNVRSPDGQVDKLLRKMEAGAHFALTQPVYSPERLEALLESLCRRGITLPVFCGIMPLTSSKNAQFLHNEVPGISIPADCLDALQRHPRLEDQRNAARDLALRLVDSCLKLNRLFYLITPRNEAGFVLPLVRFLRERGVPLAP